MMFDEQEYFKLVFRDKDIRGAFNYAVSHTPDYLYKYYSLSAGVEPANCVLDEKKLGSLSRNETWFDLAKNQNDPLDMKMAYIGNGRSNVDPSAFEAAQRLLDLLQNSFALSSFGDIDEFNLPMWQFYSNEHKGYCVRYRIKRKKAFWKVIYYEDRIPVLSIPLHVINEMERSTKLGNETPELEWYRYISIMLLNTKHSSWAQENEYRVLYPAETGSGFNLSNDSIGIEAETLFIGLNCCDTYRQRLKDICKNDLNCKCFQAKTSKDKILQFD